MLSREDGMVPLTGINRPSRIAVNLAAVAISLSADERAELDRAFAPGAIVGARYPEAVLKWAAQ
ncbi:hypothetical protein D3C76_1009900 [compost metagenome]